MTAVTEVRLITGGMHSSATSLLRGLELDKVGLVCLADQLATVDRRRWPRERRRVRADARNYGG